MLFVAVFYWMNHLDIRSPCLARVVGVYLVHGDIKRGHGRLLSLAISKGHFMSLPNPFAFMYEDNHLIGCRFIC